MTNATGISDTVKTAPAAVQFDGNGLGTMRSSGALIVLLLTLEDEYGRADILTFAAKELGISLEQLSDSYTDRGCPKCGISMVAHKGRNGECF